MPYHPVTGKTITEREATKLRKQRELEIKRIIAENNDCNAVAKWLANEKLLCIEEEIRDLGGFETKNDRYNRPSHPPLFEKIRLNHDKIIVWLGLVSISFLFWYLIWRAII